MGNVKVQRISLGFKQDLCAEDGVLVETFTFVREGECGFDPAKTYEIVTEPDLGCDDGFNEATAIESMYEASYHRTNPME